MKERILSCRNLCKTVTVSGNDIQILENISFEVNAQGSVAIVGASGSGKTTLLSLIAGLDVPTSGEIDVFGESLTHLDEDGRAALRNHYIGFVFQSFHLLPGFSALENVMLPLEINERSDARHVALHLLERVNMSHRLHHFPNTLSGGEQQRVAIARSFANAPPLLLADEPTGNLDTETGAQVIDLLFELNREHGTTLLLVTHDVALSQRCERRLCLQGGHLVEDDDKTALAQKM